MGNKTNYLALTIISVSLACAARNDYVNTGKNLIRNGDFEKGTRGWRGDKNVVLESSDEKNNICKIEVDKDENIEFFQKIKTRNIESLTVKFRVKKSSDYKGEGLKIKIDRGDGTSSGTSRTLPKNHDWNDVEWTMGKVVRGQSQISVVFVVKKGESGSLSFDNIEVFAREPILNQTPEPSPLASTSPIKADDYRVFTDKNGREIEAKILHIDSGKTKITVQRKGNRKSITVPVTTFNAETQAYIKSWSQKLDFLNESILSVKFRKKKKKVADKSTSGSSGTISWSKTSLYYGHNIEIIIQNKSNEPFEKVGLEYVLFYTQEAIGNKKKKEEKEGTLYDTQTISLPSKSKKEIKTKQIVLHTHSYESDFSSSPNLRGDLEGIMIRLTYQTETGKTITREIVYPEGRQFRWTTKTLDVQRPIF